MNYLYPIIIAASGVGWLSSKNQCRNIKSLAMEVAVRGKEIKSLKDQLQKAKLEMDVLQHLEVDVEQLRRKNSVFREKIDIMETEARAHEIVVRERALLDSIKAIQRLRG